MGDGELAEGSIWEASMAAAHYQLDNLIAIVDRNRLQISGSTEDVMSLEPLKEKFEAFGFSVREVDGNDTDALLAVFQAVPFEKGKPSLVLANTIRKGSATWKIRRNGIMAYLQKINYSRRCANLKLKERLFDMLPPLKKGLPNLEYMAQILINRAKDDPNLMIVTSDSRGSGRVTGFSEQFPQQLIEVGIAEQNSVGISAGLASCGKKVFTISPGSFLSARSFEQVKNDVAYSNNPVALLGISSGVSYGGLGATHHSIHDIAALMAVPNLDLCIPADNFETETVLESYLQYPRPMYIRFGKKTMPLFYPSANEVTFGKAGILHQGSDILIIACGKHYSRHMRVRQLWKRKGSRRTDQSAFITPIR